MNRRFADASQASDSGIQSAAGRAVSKVEPPVGPLLAVKRSRTALKSARPASDAKSSSAATSYARPASASRASAATASSGRPRRAALAARL